MKIDFDDGILAVEDLFSNQAELALLLQMSFLNDDSLAQLCRVNKRAKKICRDEDRRFRVYRERFDRAFTPEDAAALRAKKDAFYGSLYKWGLFYKHTVSAHYWLLDDRAGLVEKAVLIPALWLLHREGSKRSDLIFHQILYKKNLPNGLTYYDITDLVQHDGKIYNDLTLAEKLVLDPGPNTHFYLVRDHSHEALRIAYTQNPQRILWEAVFRQDILGLKSDRLFWLAREMDSRGDLEERRAEYLLITGVGSALTDLTGAEISWVRDVLDLPIQ